MAEVPLTMWGKDFAKEEAGDNWKTATERIAVLRPKPNTTCVWICRLVDYQHGDETDLTGQQIRQYRVHAWTAPPGNYEGDSDGGDNDQDTDDDDRMPPPGAGKAEKKCVEKKRKAKAPPAR